MDPNEGEEKEFQRQQGQWRREPGVPKKKPKYSYKTVEELKACGKVAGEGSSGPSTEPSQVKVIDMTGREPKVFYGYSQISQKHSVPEEAPLSIGVRDQKGSGFAMPELEHNLQLLIELTEQDIVQRARRLQHERDVVVSLTHESSVLEAKMAEEQQTMGRLEAALKLVERLEASSLTLQQCAVIFQTLQSEFYQEYKTLGLADLAVPVVHPLLREKLRGWDPLKDSTYGLEEVGQWRAILETTQMPHGVPDGSQMDPYHRLLWEVWVPVMRTTIFSWQPRNVGPMVDCLESWSPLLPLWILDNLLEQFIFPRLQQEVESWNPLTDPVPIHSWLHPWLPLLQGRLEPLYPTIRNKLAHALQHWHPNDGSARLILQPWRDVFTVRAWEAFMVKNIVPKLAFCLGELVINPHQQDLEPFRWVMDWEGMLSLSSLVNLLVKNFFPKWLKVLRSWLSNSPDYEEITKWYLGWKSMFSDAVLAHPLVKEQFHEALDIMNRGCNTERQKDFQYEALQERREAESVAQRAIGAAAVISSFKDLVQAKAEENDIVFVPLVGKRHDFKQLYSFGRIVIYIDRCVAFVQGEKTWVPTSLQSLIDKAK